VAIAADERIGTEVAGYRIDRVLGRGGMSVVYLAHDPRLNRNVALKLLAPELAEDEAFRARFLRESLLAASLDHPNVVPVYEAGEADGLLYLAMRYVVGSDLKALLRAEGALSPEHALALTGQVASALDAAHERGLVHRDVKPSNVLLTTPPGEEHCYLADFGLSTSASDRSVADPQKIVGTIDYVAPEQIRGLDVDGRADVYSLTCLLYECLVGDVPFRRSSDVAVIYAHLEEPLPKASERAPALPAAVDRVLERGTAKRREERWQTSAELVEAALAALGDEAAKLTVRRRRRRRAIAAALTALAAAAAAVAALYVGGEDAAIARSDSLVRIDAGSGKPAVGIAVGTRPTAVTVCAGSVWVTTRAGAVFQVEPKSLGRHRVHVRGTPSDVADVGDLAAVVSGPPEQVTVVDAQFGQISGVVDVPGARVPATAVAFGRDVWVANPSGRRLELLDPPYTAIEGSVHLPGAPRLVAAGAGAVWVAGGRMLWRIDPGARRIVRSIPLTFRPSAIAAGSGGVWLADAARDAVFRVGRGTRVERVPVGDGPVAIAVDRGAVWVANRADGTVSRIDPGRNAVVKTIDVGAEPVDLVAGLGAVWVVRRTA
jgi:YVTN family beta-propeller protein